MSAYFLALLNLHLFGVMLNFLYILVAEVVNPLLIIFALINKIIC
jgi:hypothetical protein